MEILELFKIYTKTIFYDNYVIESPLVFDFLNKILSTTITSSRGKPTLKKSRVGKWHTPFWHYLHDLICHWGESLRLHEEAIILEYSAIDLKSGACFFPLQIQIFLPFKGFIVLVSGLEEVNIIYSFQIHRKRQLVLSLWNFISVMKFCRRKK